MLMHFLHIATFHLPSTSFSGRILHLCLSKTGASFSSLGKHWSVTLTAGGGKREHRLPGLRFSLTQRPAALPSVETVRGTPPGGNRAQQHQESDRVRGARVQRGEPGDTWWCQVWACPAHGQAWQGKHLRFRAGATRTHSDAAGR